MPLGSAARCIRGRRFAFIARSASQRPAQVPFEPMPRQVPAPACADRWPVPLAPLSPSLMLTLTAPLRRDRAGHVDCRVAAIADLAVRDLHVVAVAAVAIALFGDDQHAPVAVLDRRQRRRAAGRPRPRRPASAEKTPNSSTAHDHNLPACELIQGAPITKGPRNTRLTADVERLGCKGAAASAITPPSRRPAG